MKLARREKYLIAAAASIVAVTLFFQLLILPFTENRRRLQRGIIAKQEALQTMDALSAEFKELTENAQGTKQRLAGRRKNFTLFSYLEQAAGADDIKSHIKYMKPSESTGKGPFNESLVEMKLEQVSLKQLTDYLQKIESPAELVSIRRISIQSNKTESGFLDAILQVLTVSE
jgi:general secretion pathway protein M